MARRFVPDAGDIVWLEFSPQAKREQAGHEQAGHRPALVLSPAAYNSKTGAMLCCAMTTQIKRSGAKVPRKHSDEYLNQPMPYRAFNQV